MPVTIRKAQREDVSRIYQFICDLAEYEKAREQVLCDAQTLLRGLFDEPRTAFAMMLEEGDEAIGYAIYFYNFSTWTGYRGLYLEDLYVDPAHRGKGAGMLVMETLAKQAEQSGCKRFEWAVLDWNKPAIEFYDSIGARPQAEWLNYRLDGDRLAKLAAKY